MTPVPYAATLYEWLLFLHIVAAMVWVGGLVAVNVLAIQVLRGRESQAVARFTGSLRFVGPMVFAPSVVALLAFGIWMVVDSDAWDFGQRWVQVATGLLVLAFVIGAAFQGRSALAAQAAASASDDREAVRQLTRWAWGMRLILVILLVATWDMVVKPGL